MKKNSMKIAIMMLVSILFVLPATTSAKKSVSAESFDDVLSKTVKKIVASHDNITEPLIVDSGLIDPDNGSKISFYIIPDQDLQSSSSSGDISTRASLPLSLHTLKQGSTMHYYNSNGDPWTVLATTTLNMVIRSDGQTSSTSLKYGHINASNNTTVGTVTSTGTFHDEYGTPARVWTYSKVADATSVKFYIQNLSAADLPIYGDILF
jgi:hypothetical protein